MQLCFFDDHGVNNFKPLTLTRPTFDLRVGSLTIQEKWEYDLKTDLAYAKVNSSLNSLFNPAESFSDTQLWINSRLLPTISVLDIIREMSINSSIIFQDTIIALKLDADNSIRFKDLDKFDVDKLVLFEVDEAFLINHLWDLFKYNEAEIQNDVSRLDLKVLEKYTHTPVYQASHAENIFIGKEAVIEPGVILIADEGPIIIREKAKILAGSILRGPISIGEGSTVNMGAKIYGNTTIGPACKVGGEITNSIFHSYSNKGHDGFIGHSLVGQWVNLGADTNTSNLKNNYSTVRITDWETQDILNTGQQFFGSVLGDHVKTAINTQLNTGTLAGISANIFSSTFPPKYIPSFSWLGSDGNQLYNFQKATEVMAAMMKRRGIEMSDAYLELMQFLFDESKSEHTPGL